MLIDWKENEAKNERIRFKNDDYSLLISWNFLETEQNNIKLSQFTTTITIFSVCFFFGAHHPLAATGLRSFLCVLCWWLKILNQIKIHIYKMNGFEVYCLSTHILLPLPRSIMLKSWTLCVTLHTFVRETHQNIKWIHFKFESIDIYLFYLKFAAHYFSIYTIQSYHPYSLSAIDLLFISYIERNVGVKNQI